jgi:hypothetical protein
LPRSQANKNKPEKWIDAQTLGILMDSEGLSTSLEKCFQILGKIRNNERRHFKDISAGGIVRKEQFPCEADWNFTT